MLESGQTFGRFDVTAVGVAAGVMFCFGGLGSSMVSFTRRTVRFVVLLTARSIEVTRSTVSIATVIAHVPRCKVVMMGTTVARNMRGPVTVPMAMMAPVQAECRSVRMMPTVRTIVATRPESMMGVAVRVAMKTARPGTTEGRRSAVLARAPAHGPGYTGPDFGVGSAAPPHREVRSVGAALTVMAASRVRVVARVVWTAMLVGLSVSMSGFVALVLSFLAVRLLRLGPLVPVVPVVHVVPIAPIVVPVVIVVVRDEPG